MTSISLLPTFSEPIRLREPAVYSMHVYPGNVERLNADEPPYNPPVIA